MCVCIYVYIGREVFAPESRFVIEQLLQLYTSTESHLTPSSSSMDYDEHNETTREYLTEAIARLCRVMENDFIPYLGRLLPSLFAVLSIQPKVVTTDELAAAAQDDEDAFDVTHTHTHTLGFRV